MKKFKIIETNVQNLKETHFQSETPLQTQTFIEDLDKPFRCFMFDGIRIKLVQGEDYILGERHG
jgi:hypothetical protein